MQLHILVSNNHRFLQKGLERHEHSKQVIGHVIRNGINRKRDSVSIETMKLLPGLYMSNIKHLNLEPVIVAIYEELDKKERENFAFGALLRHQVLFTRQTFYTNTLNLKEFGTLGLAI